MPKQRILYIDLLKLFTIFLVLWGHAIMHFQPDFHDSYIFRTIYAFHMPLFMMLSGYFAVSSMELSPKDFFPKKFRQLLLPCISWAIVCWLVITSGLIEGEFHLEWKGLFAGWIGLIDNFWFLKSCFICYTLTWLCWRFGRYKLPAMAVAWGLCSMQGRFFLNTMFPSFLLGVFLRQSAPFEQWITRHWYVPSSAFVALLACNLFFVEKYPYPLSLALGLSGALSFFILFKFLFSNATQQIYMKLAKLGGGNSWNIHTAGNLIRIPFAQVSGSFSLADDSRDISYARTVVTDVRFMLSHLRDNLQLKADGVPDVWT